MLIRKVPKAAKEGGRFKSQRHLKHVRGHACVYCDATAPIEAAHVRNGSDAGMGRKPSDYFAVALCGGVDGCHAKQHRQGEQTFWKGRDVAAIIEAFIQSSPVRAEIRRAQRERD